jgi:hypothetical protein
VIQELADFDRPAVGKQSRQPSLDRIVEREAAVGDELQDDRRDERLRRAGDAESLLGRCVAPRV